MEKEFFILVSVLLVAVLVLILINARKISLTESLQRDVDAYNRELARQKIKYDLFDLLVKEPKTVTEAGIVNGELREYLRKIPLANDQKEVLVDSFNMKFYGLINDKLTANQSLIKQMFNEIKKAKSN